MRFLSSGQPSSFVSSSIVRNVTLAALLPATLLASASAFARTPAHSAGVKVQAQPQTEVAVGTPADNVLGGLPPPGVNARSWVLVDATANQVLASGNADERVEPASLTKLMTAYLVFEALQSKKITMDQIVTPSEAVRRVKNDESRMFIEANKPVSVHDLVYGMIIQSGNDAAIALAELVGGSEANFVNMMNAEAQKLGMTHTHFADVNGMPDPNHYTSAGDLATLSARLIRDYPEYYDIFSVKEFKYNNIKQPNRNRLLWIDPTVDGLKTGHTQAAGYCLIASAKRPLAGGGNRRLVSVMMGEEKEHDRVQDSLKMLNYGYSAYDTTRIYQANQAVATPRVYKGTLDAVKVGVQKDQYVTLPKGAADKAKPQVELSSPLIAPLAVGQKVGTAKFVGADGKVLAQVPLVALEAVPQAGVVGRVWDSLMLMVNKKKS
ncbi:D-alanyl-D-alanine carboxypeptidase [Paraburkholderia guartelaensis]|uniref:serine-type D-Ala-D-Ala carboxypeptidase n=1 Tax=Paraburkholderia guartelaensis TaxID=2546446 RepID=A0A4R5LB11_9BURK|nr:D-alanyl-D-alanine carboxypeptidase family protein [Paraburkholderia guartelaensis]TDG05505.1 D-alanyl-D-alanine carboxypeptidase [Paraburkholderia guartelaensis]